MITQTELHGICRYCGALYVRKSYMSATCCRMCAAERKERAKRLNPRTKHETRFESAMKEVLSQVKNKDQYEKAINGASKAMYSYASIPEAMVAIELIKLGYKIIPQQQILKYHADFVIPDQKIILEIDGSLYHQKQTSRDAEIQMAMGFDWKIIHIPAELIRKDIQKLQKCIDLYK